jgi:hypothetical protein
VNQDAMKELRLGELKNALGLVSADVAARVARCLPGFFANVKTSMQARRAHLAAALKVLAKELEAEAENVLKESQ